MAFIMRDPKDMLVFSKQAKKYAAEMCALIRGVQGSVDFYRAELDENCEECIERLHGDCEKFLQQVNVYYELASQIEKKANQQLDIRFRI